MRSTRGTFPLFPPLFALAKKVPEGRRARGVLLPLFPPLPRGGARRAEGFIPPIKKIQIKKTLVFDERPLCPLSPPLAGVPARCLYSTGSRSWRAIFTCRIARSLLPSASPSLRISAATLTNTFPTILSVSVHETCSSPHPNRYTPSSSIASTFSFIFFSLASR